MRRTLSVALAVVLVAGLAGVALAHGPGWGMGYGMGYGPGSMGPGMMGGGHGMMGGWGRGSGQAGGPGACPGWAAGGPGATAPGATAPEQITEEKAKEIATEYAGKYFKGYTVERVLPVTGRLHTMYQVELKGPKGETRILHVTPWGGVRPFGPLAATE